MILIPVTEQPTIGGGCIIVKIGASALRQQKRAIAFEEVTDCYNTLGRASKSWRDPEQRKAMMAKSNDFMRKLKAKDNLAKARAIKAAKAAARKVTNGN